MKKAIVLLGLLALTSAAWAANGNPVVEMDYQSWRGYRAYQAYGDHIDVGTYWGLYLDVQASDHISLRYTAHKEVTFDTVRTWWKSGGGGAADTVELWIEGNTVSANYYDTLGLPQVNPGRNDEMWNGGWNIPDGAIKGGATNIASAVITGAAQTADFVLPSSVTIAAGETFHIRLYADPDVVDATKANKKLRLATSKQSTSSLRYLGNCNYRQYDGVPLNNGTGPDVANGDDGMAAMSLMHYYADTTPELGWEYTNIDFWGEGDFYNNGVSDYAKYKEPLFELLMEGAATGVGQGSTETKINVSTTPAGEIFTVTADSGLAGTVTKLGMFVEKNASAVEALVLSITDADGVVLASGSKAAADITTNTWVVVDLDQAVTLVEGQTYQAVATASGTAGYYKLYQHNFVGTAAYQTSNATSYLADDAYSTASSTGDILFMVNVPEPATLGLLVAGGLAVLVRRRRS